MKFKKALPKVICVLGGLALLAPLIVYAATFSQSTTPYPSGGSGPVVTATLTWAWNIHNNRSYNISGTADPANGKFQKKHWWGYSTEFQEDPGPITNSSVGWTIT